MPKERMLLAKPDQTAIKEATAARWAAGGGTNWAGQVKEMVSGRDKKISLCFALGKGHAGSREELEGGQKGGGPGRMGVKGFNLQSSTFSKQKKLDDNAIKKNADWQRDLRENKSQKAKKCTVGSSNSMFMGKIKYSESQIANHQPSFIEKIENNQIRQQRHRRGERGGKKVKEREIEGEEKKKRKIPEKGKH
ncbi:uncharacterized protein ARB_05696 [Trichophyton benhamiae CBS 112371]|uniref:Uncharacterized protein n=1 Tax=Arthroderma benhamiae (strain ATCC MYA-4681 / CBS 112371) TaxID=663331 RepID=D4AN91_ARTBC|nr:uncharacterized protein ARB_05696 [Trichophyton benhamiae CBS 112371]EFE35652.1 hypothetical protein ARB_05696 [Trichophyton benhamiae CBS 112371]